MEEFLERKSAARHVWTLLRKERPKWKWHVPKVKLRLFGRLEGLPDVSLAPEVVAPPTSPVSPAPAVRTRPQVEPSPDVLALAAAHEQLAALSASLAEREAQIHTLQTELARAKEEEHKAPGGKGKQKGPPLLPPKGQGKNKDPALPPEGKGKQKGPPLPPPKGKGKNKGPPLPPPKGKGKHKGPPLPPPKGKGKGSSSSSSAGVTGAPRKSLVKVENLGRKLSLKSAPSSMGCLSLLHQAAAGMPTSVDPTKVDFEALSFTFFRDTDPTARPSWMRKEPQVAILLPQLAQNLGIVMKKLGSDLMSAVVCLLFLDNAAGFDPEIAARLLAAWPATPENEQQITELLAYIRKEDANINGMREVDRQLLVFALMPRIRHRLRLYCLMSCLEERRRQAFDQLRLLANTINRLRTSQTLQHLISIVAVLYNYVNFGTPPDADVRLKGVDISSLASLQATKCTRGAGPFLDFNMLHFAIYQLCQQDRTRTLRDLQDDVRNLRAASAVRWDCLLQEVRRLYADLRFVTNELRTHRQDYFQPDLDQLEIEISARHSFKAFLAHPNGPEVLEGFPNAYDLALKNVQHLRVHLKDFLQSFLAEMLPVKRDVRAFVRHFGMEVGPNKTSANLAELMRNLLEFTDQVQKHWQELHGDRRKPTKSPRTSRSAGASRRLSRTLARSSTEDTILEE